MTRPRLSFITLGARDLPRLRAFYEALGWQVTVELGDFCAFELENVLLALFPLDRLATDGQTVAAGPTKGLRGASLAIDVARPDDVDAFVALAARAGATVTKQPVSPPGFPGRHAYFADPEENYWEVVHLDATSTAKQVVDRLLRRTGDGVDEWS